jgi:hypothetical protein
VSEKAAIDDVFLGISATRKYQTLRALMQPQLASKGFPASEIADGQPRGFLRDAFQRSGPEIST